MISLSPREKFTIVRGLGDHTDATTYYVRAVIRNSRTDELIATVDLDDSGDGLRFIKQWQVPADPSGQGFYIDITTSIYTDSGYTTKTTKYYDEYDTYLIAERMNPLLGYGGGGGSDISYKKIEEIIRKVVKEIPEQEKISIPETDLVPVLESILDVKLAIRDIPKVDLSDIKNELKSIKLSVDDKEEYKQISSDSSNGLLKQMDSLKSELSDLISRLGETSMRDELMSVADKADSALTKIQTFFTDDMNALKSKIDEIQENIKSIESLETREIKIKFVQDKQEKTL
jgi:hypothetical protein